MSQTIDLSGHGAQTFAILGSGGILLPAGNNAERPATGSLLGLLRYNTAGDVFEGFTTGGWSVLQSTGASGFLATAGGTLTGNLVFSGGGLQIQNVSGTAPAPSYSFALYPGSGLFNSGANQVAIATAGTTRVTVLANGTVDINGLQIVPPISLSLPDNTASPTPITSFPVTYNAAVIEYSLRRAGATDIGTLYVANDSGTATSTQTAMANLGVSFTFSIGGGNVVLNYTTTSTGNATSMCYHMRRWIVP